MTTDDDQTFVIVGAGLAAGKAVEALRDNGFGGRIIVFGEENHRPYERPPLSKGYLMGNDELETAFVHTSEWYPDHDVDLRLATKVTAIDPASRTVATGDQEHPFDRLLIATGASPRHLQMADDSGAPVAYLRTIEDSGRIKGVLGPGQRVAIVGGGWIGLEVAAAARTGGSDVTVLETLELPLLRVLGPEVARVFAALHQEHGVDLRTEVEVSAIEEDHGHGIVRLGDGTVAADLVVVGVGVLPNTALGEAAGLETDNGIVVDEQLRTSAPEIFAAGDVANAYHPLLGRHLRVEHWDNAIEQGIVAARNMLGEGVGYDRLPYFFTDQYDLGMEYVGSVGPEGYDEVVLRGDPERRTFTAFWLGAGQVLAAMHANDWDASDLIKQIVGATNVADSLRDESVPLDQIAELSATTPRG